MKIGIMGGTFDPVHYGHIGAAREVREKLLLDQILFLPSGNPAYKQQQGVTAAGIRYEMLKEAIAGEEGFLLSDMEIRRDGPTYTVDTLRELHEKAPRDTEFYYIIGADVVAELNTWKDYKAVFPQCTFAAVCRPGYSDDAFSQAVRKMQSLGAKIVPVEITQRDISSSGIRQKAAAGESIEDLVPPSVWEIIFREGLYRK